MPQALSTQRWYIINIDRFSVTLFCIWLKIRYLRTFLKLMHSKRAQVRSSYNAANSPSGLVVYHLYNERTYQQSPIFYGLRRIFEQAFRCFVDFLDYVVAF